MKKIIMLLICATFIFSAYGKKVSLENAKQIAKNHYSERENMQKNYDNIKLSLAYNPEIQSEYAFYVFDVADNKGYIIVSADDAITPILAFSTSGKFDINNIAVQQKLLYDYYSAAISYVQKNEVVSNDNVAPRWEKLRNYFPINESKETTYSSPVLLGDISWNQMEPYNAMCPIKNEERTPVGCVATAMGMVMKYWNWPSQGVGSYTHTSYWNGGFPNITINFANQTYDWGAIPDVGTQENDELAKLLYHLGVSLRMQWDNEGSGSTTSCSLPLTQYFKYSAQSRDRASLSDAVWISLLKTEIDANRPIIYDGFANVGGSYSGHAWVCDGYQERTEGDFFHMNWGWGPYGGNNFCALDNLISSATTGGEELNFTYYNSIVIGIKPNTEFTYGCTNLVTHGFEGSFDDGSVGEDYKNNLDCSYLIQPDCGKNINIKFSKFDLAAGDEIRIYSDINATNLVATYSNSSSLPYNGTEVPTGTALIKFITDGQNQADGWKATYSVTTCGGDPIYFTENSGLIEDGSGECPYNNSLNCRWIIAPSDCNRISFSFNNFNFYTSSSDRLRIYKSTETTESSNLLYTFRNSNPPDGTYTVETDTLLVWFQSGASSSAEGFDMQYNAFTSDVSSYLTNNNIIAFPNPSSCEDLQFQFTNVCENNVTVSLINILGEQIATKKINIQDNSLLKLSEITTQQLNNGIFYLRINTKKQNTIVKFSIIN